MLVSVSVVPGSSTAQKTLLRREVQAFRNGYPAAGFGRIWPDIWGKPEFTLAYLASFLFRLNIAFFTKPCHHVSCNSLFGFVS
jgi:hypothetical protein